MKNLCLLFVATCLNLSAFAYDFVADGIYYKITSSTEHTVAVTLGTPNYTDTVSIPAAVVNNSITYSVTAIDADAFAYCIGLKSITIPSSITAIGMSAFWECRNLASIYVYHTTPIYLSASADILVGVPVSTCVLHVPAGTANLYDTASVWKDFTHIEEMSITGTSTLTGSQVVNIYPNPATDAFYISGVEGEATIEIYTLQGQLLLNENTPAHRPIAVGAFNHGVYLVKIKSPSGEVTKELMKQ
jgi:hypothetical protein